MKKVVFLALVILTISMNTFAKEKIHTLKADWDEESLYFDKMTDNETLVVKLPKYGTKVSATITDNPLNQCKVTSIKYKGNIVEVSLYLGETNFDDGFNGCSAEIVRNGKNDEDGIGIINVTFGFGIDG